MPPAPARSGASTCARRCPRRRTWRRRRPSSARAGRRRSCAYDGRSTLAAPGSVAPERVATSCQQRCEQYRCSRCDGRNSDRTSGQMRGAAGCARSACRSVAAQFGQTIRRFSSRLSSCDAVDVVEDQASSAGRATARLTPHSSQRARLQALREEPPLERAAAVGRAARQVLRQRARHRSRRAARADVREGRSARSGCCQIALGVLPQRRVVAAGGAHARAGGAPRCRTSMPRSPHARLALGVSNVGHEHMFASPSDGTPRSPGDWGARIRTGT